MGIASFKNVRAQVSQTTTTTTTIADNDDDDDNKNNNDRSNEQREEEEKTNFVNKQFNVSECSSIVYFYFFL